MQNKLVKKIRSNSRNLIKYEEDDLIIKNKKQ
jgi:hypothetical protein